MNRFHTSRALEVLIDFILLQNGRKRFHKTGARRFWKRFSVLLNFHVPPRLKIPTMSPWSTNWFHTFIVDEVWNEFVQVWDHLILFSSVEVWNELVHRVRQKYEIISSFFNCVICMKSFHPSSTVEVWNELVLLLRKNKYEIISSFLNCWGMKWIGTSIAQDVWK